VTPSRWALRLLSLFSTADQYEAVLGDLLEEFSARARVSKRQATQYWLWRQVW
jgi:hypothetical protein